MNIKFVFAKHDGCDKEYVFEVPDSIKKIEIGDLLLVDTSRGKQVVTATSTAIQSNQAEQIASRFGAYFPLKKVLQHCSKEFAEYFISKAEERIVGSLFGQQDIPIPDVASLTGIIDAPFEEVVADSEAADSENAVPVFDCDMPEECEECGAGCNQ